MNDHYLARHTVSWNMQRDLDFIAEHIGPGEAYDGRHRADVLLAVHVGRSWSGHQIEDVCGCPQAPCGLVDSTGAAEDCDDHGPGSSRTMRQMHRAADCPGAPVTAERPPSPGYSFTLVEQPGGAS